MCQLSVFVNNAMWLPIGMLFPHARIIRIGESMFFCNVLLDCWALLAALVTLVTPVGVMQLNVRVQANINKSLCHNSPRHQRRSSWAECQSPMSVLRVDSRVLLLPMLKSVFGATVLAWLTHLPEPSPYIQIFCSP